MASSKKDTNFTLTKANCIIIRGKVTNEECLEDVESILHHFEPIILRNYGDEDAGKEELISKYHMPNNLGEVGKFYDHEGSYLWYYYVYGQLTRSKKAEKFTENLFALQLLNKDIYGDIAIVRSGPVTSTIDPWLSMDKLAQTVKFHETNDPDMIFRNVNNNVFFKN